MIRLRALAVALAAASAVLVSGVSPAGASITTATLDEPPEKEAVISTPRIPLSGTFKVDRGGRQINGGVKRDMPKAATVTFSIKSFNGDRFAAQTDEALYNGRYLIELVYVNDNAGPLSGCRDQICTAQFSRAIRLAVPPADPKGVAVTYAEKERKVTVTWDKAPELDIKGWRVQRRVDGGKVEDMAAVKPTETPAYLDSGLPDAGGKLEYIVTAVRAGDTDQTSVESKPVSKSVEVGPRPPDAPPPPPPGATTTTTSPFGPVVTAPPASGSQARTVVTPNVGAFASGLNGKPGGTTRTTLPDGTYEETLPYGDQELEPGEEGAGPIFKNETPGTLGDPLSFLFYAAAASLAFVVSMHVLFILRQVKRADAAALAPLDLTAAPDELATVAPDHAVEPGPRRRVPRVAKRIGSDDPPPPFKRIPRKVR